MTGPGTTPDGSLTAAPTPFAGPRSCSRLRTELEDALRYLPEDGMVFTRAEVDKIAERLGGYVQLRDLLELVEDTPDV